MSVVRVILARAMGTTLRSRLVATAAEERLSCSSQRLPNNRDL
jgi:hypothetical protein